MATHCNTLQHTQVSLYLTSSLHLYSFHTAAATHRITLQHASTHCNTLQHTATHCSTLQHTATHCNTLQHTATHCSLRFSLYSTNSLLLCVFHSAAATHCNTLQHASTHCNTTFLGSNGDLITQGFNRWDLLSRGCMPVHKRCRFFLPTDPLAGRP